MKSLIKCGLIVAFVAGVLSFSGCGQSDDEKKTREI